MEMTFVQRRDDDRARTSGRLVGRSPELSRRRDAAARRRPTVDELSLALDAEPLQLKRLDSAVTSVHREIAHRNRDYFGDAVPAHYVLQRRSDGAEHADGDHVRATAARGVAGGGGALPYLDVIQAAFGRHDVTGVRAHVGGAAGAAAEAIGAEAYATGDRVAFRGGPTLHTAAHEAAHVVQQRAGVSLKGGVGAAGDAYERHADAVADLVVQGKSAEGLLDRMAGGGKSTAVQRKESPKVKANAGTVTAISAAVSVRLWGPLKFEGQIAGNQVQKGALNKNASSQTELEVAISGGVVADFVIAQLRVGVEGKVKFTTPTTGNPVEVVKKGLAEVINWKLAKDFAAKFQAAQVTIDAAATTARDEITRHIELVHKGTDSALVALGSVLSNYDRAVAGALKSVGATLLPGKTLHARAKAIAKPYIERYEKATTVAERKTPITQYHGELLAAVNLVTSSVAQVASRATAPRNDPSVGFDASLSLKVGASANASKGVSGGVEVSVTAGITDGKGKQWDHKTHASKAITGKVKVGSLEVAVTGSIKDDDQVQLGLTITGTLNAAPSDPALTVEGLRDYVKSAGSFKALASYMKGGKVGSLGHIKNLVQSFGQGVAAAVRAEMEPQKKGAKASGSASIILTVQVAGSLRSRKLTGGSLKLANVNSTGGGGGGVSGKVDSGTFAEVSL